MSRRSAPNIVLIVLDSVRRDHLSCYGHDRPTTPHIDRIAEEGVRFEQAYATSCWTIPSHASLFTGLYPSQHGADLLNSTLDPEIETIATRLGGLGYRTGLVSCNSFVVNLTEATSGFDLGVDLTRLAGGPEGLFPRAVRAVHRRWRSLTARDRGARKATDVACDWLERQGEDRPFFLFLNYMECHLPYRLRGAARYRFVATGDQRRADRVPQDPFGAMAGARSLSREALRDLQALYDGSLHYMDAQVGRLRRRLEELSLLDDTIFILTADHGESFGEHGLLDHQYGLYEHLIRVPLILRAPGRCPAGQVHDRLVQHVDLLPTLARWLEPTFDRGPETAGIPIFGDEPRDTVMAEYLVPNVRAIRRRFPEADVSRFDVGLRAIRVEDFKLIQRTDGDAELYDLAEDPGERRNLAATKPDVVERLGRRLTEALGAWVAPPPSEEDEEGLERVQERLKELGYL